MADAPHGSDHPQAAKGTIELIVLGATVIDDPRANAGDTVPSRPNTIEVVLDRMEAVLPGHVADHLAKEIDRRQEEFKRLMDQETEASGARMVSSPSNPARPSIMGCLANSL